MAFARAEPGGGIPFACETCGETDKETRNCGNHKSLSEEARAVLEYTPEVAAEIQERGVAKVSVPLSGLRFYECPLSYVTTETHEIVRAVFLIDVSGHLLYAGGWGDQPAWLVEAYEIFRVEQGARGKRGERKD